MHGILGILLNERTCGRTYAGAFERQPVFKGFNNDIAVSPFILSPLVPRSFASAGNRTVEIVGMVVPSAGIG